MGSGSDATGFTVFDAGVAGVFAQPVEAAVFFVGVEGRGGVFAEAGGDCEAAGTGADDEDVMDRWEGCCGCWWCRIGLKHGWK